MALRKKPGPGGAKAGRGTSSKGSSQPRRSKTGARSHRRVDKRVAKRTLYAAAADVEEEDVEHILERKSEFDNKLHDVPDRFTKLVKQLQLLFELIQDWWGGRYKGVPWLSVTMAAAAVLYFVNPLDIIPDVIPIVGYLDDAVVVGLAIAALKEDLKKYCATKGYKLADYF